MRSMLLGSILLCCGAAFAQDAPNVVISGVIADPTVVSITIDDHALPVAEDGAFQLETSIPGARTFTLSLGGRTVRIHAAPGDRVELRFDERDIYGTLEFSGDEAAVNRYLLAEDGIGIELAPFFQIGREPWVELFRLGETDFLGRLDGFRRRYLQALDAAGIADRAFLADTRMSIKLAFDWFILQYPQFHSRYTGAPTQLSDATQAYLEAVDVDDPALLGNEEYVRFTRDWLRPRIREVFQAKAEEWRASDNQWLRASLAVVSEVFVHPATRAHWWFFFLEDHIERNGVKNLEPFIAEFNAMEDHEELKRRLNDLYRGEKSGREDHPVLTYKTVNGFDLDAHLFAPAGLEPGETRPAVVYFHGGSWSEGKPDWQFGPSPHGFVKFCIEYRTYDRHRALPTDAVADAKSAIRWVRRHAGELHVDPDRIIAAGNSAGAHLALCTALVEGMDEAGEDLSVSSRPNALILTSAVYGLDENVWFADELGDPERLQAISPLNLVRPGLAPMLIFHGTEDLESAPFSDCRRFVEASLEAGNTVDFHPLQGLGHALWLSGAYWQEAAAAEAAFLRGQGYLSAVDR